MMGGGIGIGEEFSDGVNTGSLDDPSELLRGSSTSAASVWKPTGSLFLEQQE